MSRPSSPADARHRRPAAASPARARSGSRMSGGDAWAIVDPSTNSTMECTIDCGCTTTSMRSYGTPNRRCASMTSRPLLTRVAEFVVTMRPMSQVGWSSASAGVTSCQRLSAATAERAAGCRQHESPHLVARAAAQRLGDRGVLRVDRDDLPRARDRRDEVAADDQRLLVREREGAAHLERGEGRAQSDRAGDAVEHDVRLDVAHQLLGLDGAERGVLDVEFLGLSAELLPIGSGCQPDDLEPPRVGADDLERLSADRTGGAEDEHATHRASLAAAAAPRHRAARRPAARSGRPAPGRRCARPRADR